LGMATFLKPNMRILLQLLTAIYVGTDAAGMAGRITSMAR